MPKVSIHMCTYNRAHFIQEALNSVLSQTFRDFELLILDDCSTDTTEDVIRPYLSDTRIRYVKNPVNLGITKNRNYGLLLSTGEYVAVLDSDDYWINPHKLEMQVKFLDSHLDYTLVGTNMSIVDEHGNNAKEKKYPTKNFVIKNVLLIKNFFCHSSVLYRKKEVLNLGGYDEGLAIWEDYDLWLRIGFQYNFANLSEVTTAYRRHGNQSNSVSISNGKDTQKLIINRYGNRYNFHIVAKIINSIRNLITHHVSK